MEDDDETSSQMLNNNSIASLLYCDEDPLNSSTTPPRPPPPLGQQQQQQQAASLVLATTVGDVEEEDHLKELLVDHMARQRFYAPTCRGGYLEHLLLPPPQQQGSTPPEAAIIPGSGTVSAARSRGVHYIIYVSITHYYYISLSLFFLFGLYIHTQIFSSLYIYICTVMHGWGYYLRF